MEAVDFSPTSSANSTRCTFQRDARLCFEMHMTLREWQKRRLVELRGRKFRQSQHSRLMTLIAYAFPCDVESEAFDWIECAVLQSWAVLGALKTTLVVHRDFCKVKQFAAAYPDWVDVQIETSLEPGKIETMSADCNNRLHSRFDTPYCLVIQDDGFPLQNTLDEFLGKYDFIGAPYVRIACWRNLVCRVLGLWVSNGGFSLRSKRICEAAAYWWNRKYRNLHPCEATVDDLYYTRTLPIHHPSFRFQFKIADNRAALRFSYDDIVKQPITKLPFGFHRASTFEALQFPLIG